MMGVDIRTVCVKLTEIKIQPNGYQNGENHWPRASGATFVHLREGSHFPEV
jgi:hypothetical protein